MKKQHKIVFISLTVVVISVGTFLYLKGKHGMATNSISGIVTSKFTDCVGGSEIDAKGKITPIKDVSCDGGSTITLDYKDTFVTGSGDVPQGQSYSVNVSNIKVGNKVTVRYILDHGYKSLNCKNCMVTLYVVVN